MSGGLEGLGGPELPTPAQQEPARIDDSMSTEYSQGGVLTVATGCGVVFFNEPASAAAAAEAMHGMSAEGALPLPLIRPFKLNLELTLPQSN
jgi:hypothetical protein